MNEPQSCPMITYRKAGSTIPANDRMVDTCGFGGTDVVEESREIVGELLERVLLRFIGFVGLAVT